MAAAVSSLERPPKVLVFDDYSSDGNDIQRRTISVDL